MQNYGDHVRAVVDEAPPLKEWQKDRLRQLLSRSTVESSDDLTEEILQATDEEYCHISVLRRPQIEREIERARRDWEAA